MNADHTASKLPGLDTVRAEVGDILRAVSQAQLHETAETLSASNAVFLTGKGRSGLVGQAFAMRLMQLGLRAHVVGEATAPAVGPGDLVVAVSGSGATACTLHVVEAAKRHGAKVFAVTAEPHSPLATLADGMLVIPRPAQPSRQPGMTFFEQAALLALDAVVLLLMERLGATEESLLARHANLE
jgi:6-phospho-3-hexuloisomerase